MKKCKITIDKIIFEVVLFNSPTANKIWNSLPNSSNIKTWGKEIYFYTDVCNIWGETKIDLKKLKNIAEGQPIKIEKI